MTNELPTPNFEVDTDILFLYIYNCDLKLITDRINAEDFEFHVSFLDFAIVHSKWDIVDLFREHELCSDDLVLRRTDVYYSPQSIYNMRKKH
jgi:hypothetical protein